MFDTATPTTDKAGLVLHLEMVLICSDLRVSRGSG